MLQLTFLSPARLEQLGQQSFSPQIQPIIPTWFHISHCSTVNNPLFPKSKGMQRDSMASAGRPQQRTHAGHHGILYFGSKSRAVRPWIGNERNGIWLGLCLEQLDRYYYVLDDLGEKKQCRQLGIIPAKRQDVTRVQNYHAHGTCIIPRQNG